MSEQNNQAEQTTMTPQELRERMLEELEASKQAIAELSDEELEEVAGGAGRWGAIKSGLGRAARVVDRVSTSAFMSSMLLPSGQQ